MYSRVSCFGRVNIMFFSHVSVYTLAKESLKLHALSWSRAKDLWQSFSPVGGQRGTGIG